MNQKLLTMLILIITYFFFLLFNADTRAGCSIMSSGTTEHLSGVWGSSGSDVFAVGSNGTILHYNGLRWSPMNSGTSAGLNGIWGSSGSDVFVIGGDVDYEGNCIYRYDNSEWLEMDCGFGTLRGIWGISATDIFVVGADGEGSVEIAWGYFFHYDGTTWNPIISNHPDGYPVILGKPLFSIWGSSGTDIILGGSDNSYHYNGSSELIRIPCNQVSNFSGIWGSSGKDVFAVGGRGRIVHYDGDDDCDNDGILDGEDNCPCMANLDQEDSDGNGIGDVCEGITTTTTTTVLITTTTTTTSSTTTTGNFPTTTSTTPCPIMQIYGEYSTETQLLRSLRDNLLRKTQEGRELIRFYYQWSPVIVRAMEADEEFKQDIKEMLDEVLGVVE